MAHLLLGQFAEDTYEEAWIAIVSRIGISPRPHASILTRLQFSHHSYSIILMHAYSDISHFTHGTYSQVNMYQIAALKF